MMNIIKRYLGILLLLVAPAILYALVDGAISNIDSRGTKEINNPVIWIIIIAIFAPIALGLIIFGWYAFRGEYDHLPESSKELDEF
jgi:hypothetical protein